MAPMVARASQISGMPDERQANHHAGEHGRPQVHDQHAQPVRVAHVEQPVVQVLPVGREGRLARPGPADHREQQVCVRDDQDRERQQQRQDGREPVDRVRVRVVDQDVLVEGRVARDRAVGEQHAEQHRPGVAHEDPRRVEVMRQEPDADARQHGRRHRGHRLRRDVRRSSPACTSRPGMTAPKCRQSPAARPSRPSMKFTALIVMTTIRIVRVKLRSGSSRNVSLPGNGIHGRYAPLHTRMPPAAICPASLLIAPIPNRSSTIPMSTSRPPASSSPVTVRDEGKACCR